MEALIRIFKIKDVRNSIFFVLAMLVVFRITAHIPVPGVDAAALTKIFDGNQLFGLMNIFSGGTLQSFSIVAMGVAPYITSSIIFQLLGIIQAYGLIILLSQKGSIFHSSGLTTMIFAMISMTAGTIFLMWIGEMISEKNIGNGISILIIAGIISGLPTFLSQSLSVYDKSQLVTMILFALIVLVTIVSVVVMNEAQRNVPVQYTRHVRGSKLSGAVTSHIPLRLNMGGVIPIIFAISIILFPTVLAQFFLNARTEFLREAATWTLQVFQNQLFYGVTYFLMVFFFTYFYTAVIFHPDQVAENIQKQGGFIPGIRPGKNTSDYLSWVTNRLLLLGATFLALIAVLPLIVQHFTGSQNLVIGGTSILIIVAVVIDSVKQIEAQLTMREYDI